jgi:predicted transglutaminase-like cysteine proteinase
MGETWMSGRLWAVVLALACLASPASDASGLATKGDAPPLAAWTAFCQRLPAECAVDTAEPELIAATPETLELVEAVNRHVNRTITPQTDQDHWGVVDHWGFPPDGIGDCEDFQLLKRRLLVEAGLPRRALRMTVVINELGEGHAVLTLRTVGRDLILDNRTSDILTWQETGYSFIKREKASGIGWVFLDPPALALAAIP